MKKIIALSALAAVFTLTGCDKIYTVDEFYQNNELRQEFRQKCNNGELPAEHQNCVNQKEANLMIPAH